MTKVARINDQTDDPTEVAVMDKQEIETAVKDARLQLCDLLTELDEQELATPSLCSGWTVREVAAHLTVTTRATVGFALKEAVKARGSFDRMTSNVAHDRSARFSTAELIEQLRESAESSRRMPGSGPMDPLMDLLIHLQDIARPLKRNQPINADVAGPTLTYVTENRLLGAPKRLAGLELVATDVSWTSGTGQQVRGTTEDLLLVASGRPAGLEHLTGEGVERLAERLTGRH